MSAVIPLREIQSIRDTARRAGFDAASEIGRYVRLGCPKTFINDLSERARQARMARNGGAA